MVDLPPEIRRWKPAPILPERDTRELSLHFVVGVLCFLACLAALTFMATSRAADGWSRDIRGEVTVQVRPKGVESGYATASQAAEVLAGVKGVSEAAALEEEKAIALIKPWVGDVVVEDLPLPYLVEVRLNPDAPATVAALEKALKAAGISATIDDHSRWLKDVQQAAWILRGLAGAIFLLTGGAAAAVIAFATRAGLEARRDVVEVLSLNGAVDLFIANLFQTRFAQLAAEAGILGSLGAALLLIVLKLVGSDAGLMLALPLSWFDLLVVLPCPILAALIAAITARITAMRLLRGL